VAQHPDRYMMMIWVKFAVKILHTKHGDNDDDDLWVWLKSAQENPQCFQGLKEIT
jgi:hypothetical protein